jgi:hypothetical protein
MQIVDTYSFKGGEKFIKTKHQQELKEVLQAIENVDATACLVKESQEKTMMGKLLFSPLTMNNYLKLAMHEKGWTEKVEGKKKVFREPRYAFGKNRFREMDGLKNKVGLEIQFGKYAFMGYDIFSKMVIFNKLRLIECGIEVVPGHELVRQMSTGVSDFEQLLVDFEYRGESNIDIPVFVISLGLTPEEKIKCQNLQELFKTNREKALKAIQLKKYNGSLPGPKKS